MSISAMLRIIRRLVGAAALTTALAVPVIAPSPGQVSADAPTAAACNANTQFCGVGLHVKNGSTTVITSKAIGAHYGSIWAIPTGPNNSTGIAFCMADAFTGTPTGAISEQPLPSMWTQDGLRKAGYILAMFSGDKVSPYQPITIDGAGEFVGYNTRQRFVAAHLALLSVLPNYMGGGSYLDLVDPATMQLFANAAGTTPSSFQAVAPLVQQMVAAANSHNAGGSDIVLSVSEGAFGVLTVTATKDGLPVPDLPIWPTSTTGVSYTGTTSSTAYANATTVVWPSLDYSTSRPGAGVTDASGQATFSVTAPVLAAGVEFNTEEAPGTVHVLGDGQNSQDNLTWYANEIRPYSIMYATSAVFELQSQVSNASPLVGETISDAIIILDLADGVTLTVEVEAFDLTVDPTGAGTPLGSAQVAGLGNGTHPGLVPYMIVNPDHTIGYRHRAVAASDGSLLTPTAWSELGIPSETAVGRGLTAETHLRKSVSGDGTTWINAQKDTTPAYTPAGAPADPRLGSHDDGVGDAGDGVPVYAPGTKVSFGYEVWLNPASTGVVTWPTGTTGIVTDDNGTGEPDDDFQPIYLSGDDGDAVLELGETWLYQAIDIRTAVAGEVYSNYSALPGGEIHSGTTPGGPSMGTTTPRTDPAGYLVPSCSTVAINPADQTKLVSPQGGTVHDTVACTNLVVGVPVTVTGELQIRQPDGSVVPSGITGSMTFTPASSSDSTVVPFTVPASASPATYVVFETLTVTETGKSLGGHQDPNDADQTIRKRTPLKITTTACHQTVTMARGATTGGNCDINVVEGDPGDVVSGSTIAYKWVNGVRQCDAPSMSVEWSVTIDADGSSTITTPDVLGLAPAKQWEFLHSATTPDGRVDAVDCLTAPFNPAESFEMKRGGGGGNLPSTGSDPQQMLLYGAVLTAAGVLLSLASWRRRRRVTAAAVAV